MSKLSLYEIEITARKDIILLYIILYIFLVEELRKFLVGELRKLSWRMEHITCTLPSENNSRETSMSKGTDKNK